MKKKEPAGRHPSLSSLRAAARECRACPLWRPATQTVFGEGPANARIILVGEEPGDREDILGRPFVGPAGQLLRRALVEAGLDPAPLYLTNVVKHFKFEVRGKRRLHKRVNAEEQAACRQWLQAELDRIRPAIVVCLGATAAKAPLGRSFSVTRQRGRWLPFGADAFAIATLHPSALLRVRDSERERGYLEFARDLRKIAAGPEPVGTAERARSAARQ
jgi:DNA polymerase